MNSETATPAGSGHRAAGADPHGDDDEPTGGRLAGLALAALGIVFGDLGTSPLYALRECFFGEYAIAVTPANILGVLSLIIWALIIIISIKYLCFILRADNNGEGGIIALLALVHPERPREEGAATPGPDAKPAAKPRRPRSRRIHMLLVFMGLFGAALLYGDGMITPAISVLSAVEGLEVATPLFAPYVVPITIAILVGLFLFQERGTSGIGAIFGPITLLWFLTLAALGLRMVVREPAVLAAVNPLYGADFFVRNGVEGFFVLGAVFLVVTGGEALYADIGHFGTRPIRVAWFGLVLPALLLNYFGQGALLLGDPAAAHNPFYRLAPEWALYPLVALATVATIIASQAVISGAFSLTRQAIQLGFCPRLEIRHTSAEAEGQIYMPTVNWMLMAATIGLVLGFGSSSDLAAAYGVAVSTDMVITTIIFAVVAGELWDWPVAGVGLLAAGFLIVDVSFFGANIVKVPDGGWFPLVIAALAFTLFTTWRRGRRILSKRLQAGSIAVDQIVENLTAHPPTRVPGTAVFMTGEPNVTPRALLHNLKHNKVLHERVVFLTVATEDVPHVPLSRRVRVDELGGDFYGLTVRYGFMQDPDVPRALQLAARQGLEFRIMETTFFVGRERVIASHKKKGMALWREKLFTFMGQNAQAATEFFRLPPNRIVYMGAEVEL